jgi:hypothetical protein
VGTGDVSTPGSLERSSSPLTRRTLCLGGSRVPVAPNARRQLLPTAGARHERRLLAVSCTPLLGAGPGTGLRSDDTLRRPPPRPPQDAGPAPWEPHRRAGHAHRASVPGWAGHHRGCRGLPPPAGHPPRPAKRAPRGPPPLRRPARTLPRPGAGRGGAAPATSGARGAHPRRRHGDTPRAQSCGGRAPEARAGRGGRVAGPRGGAGRAPAHASRSSFPGRRGTYTSSRGACTRWRSPSRVGWCFPSWRDALAGAPGLGKEPLGFSLPRPWRPTPGFRRWE